ncbi:IucA/IucC family C-terminal-domain containing protein [Paenibacillus sp. CF384]|uniref:IucA/IucC family C-terminal-domain containing protein n=1 Tax=Paenibacillus sp. CF384 TaxID=1884382 RepID=UPI000898410F|nr:IucA/IucC family C-terminal-domain containing protein [Paenibacillus sp. CF384]SDX37665.1 Ferric iron reductase protein FhuF, involved in iron transport [Paenibacillus sp. CF384]
MLPLDPNVIVNRHKFNFGAPSVETTVYSFEGTDPAVGITELVDRFASQINAPDNKTVGMLFWKRYCALFAGAVYTWLHQRYPLDLSFQNVRFVQSGANVKFYLLSDAPVTAITLLQSETEQDEAYLRHLFHDHASQVIAAVVSHTGVPVPGMWHTIAYLLAHWKQTWLRESPSEAFTSRIEQWFEYATRRLEPDWLPGRAVNPMSCTFRAVEDPLHEGRSILVRRACCMNYRLPGDDDPYCYTCPLITDELRIKKFLESHA